MLNGTGMFYKNLSIFHKRSKDLGILRDGGILLQWSRVCECVCVCVCVCCVPTTWVCDQKYTGGFPLTHGWSDSILIKSAWGKDGCGWSKMWPNKQKGDNLCAAITAKRWGINLCLLLYINRKSYIRSPMILTHVTLSNTEGQIQGHLGFEAVIFHIGPQLGHKLLLNTHRKPYMGSSVAPSYLTLSDMERSKSGSLRFQILMCTLGRSRVRPYVTIKINSRLYMGSGESSCEWTFDREWPWKALLNVTHILNGKRYYIIVSILIWMSHKGICGRPRFSAVPEVFLVYVRDDIPNRRSF